MTEQVCADVGAYYRDAVYKSSLFGSFAMAKAVWPVMRAQTYGRILNCISGAGLYGNFGQVNYAAVKMGLVGFTVALNREGAVGVISLCLFFVLFSECSCGCLLT